MAKHGPHSESDTSTGSGFDDAANVASNGAVLPDPEEIKLPPLYKSEEHHRTVIDVDKPKDSNADDDKEDHSPFDYRGNK
jgi:hypothetical protein